MNLKQLVFHLRQAFEDNPAIAVLAGCCAGVALFFGLMVLPRYYRRWKRRAREKRRRMRAEFKI